MIDYSEVTIGNVSIHHVGNKNNNEELLLSKAALQISDSKLQALLVKFFLPPFSSNEYFSFSFSNDDFNLNPLFNFTSDIFDDSEDFHISSKDIAKHLYEVSVHPQIKSGDLFVVHFSNILLDGKNVEAVGLFKSEHRHAFLKLDISASDFSLNYDDGINIEKLDKGCLVFNTEKASGYKICIVDKSNKAIEAQYWKDHFLTLRTCNDEYHQTKDFLNITKNYVTKQITEDFELTKTDQIDMLNRSMEYFKKNESFDKASFEKEVFQSPEVIESFRKFDEVYRDENAIELDDHFDISQQAVKKQARIFKSVLKLDKNFHIYIHGDKEMIEQGVDKDGRKFYKIFYEKEA